MVRAGDIKWLEHTGQCSYMCRGGVVGPGDIKFAEHTGKVLQHMQKQCGQTVRPGDRNWSECTNSALACAEALWSDQGILNGQSTENSAHAYAEAVWCNQGILNGRSTQEWCSCICRSTVVGAGDIKWLEHTGQCSCMCRSSVVCHAQYVSALTYSCGVLGKQYYITDLLCLIMWNPGVS